VPPQVLPNPDHVRVLDQGPEGSAVGHGMASMINYLLRERGIRDQVSARMLQQLSKEVGGTPPDAEGSMLHDGMRGWLEHGVCSESQWPYRAHEWGELTPERERDAQKYKPAGYRNVRKDVRVMQAALVECKAAVVACTVHEGWMTRSVKDTIRFTGKEQVVGGHAFAVLGYTEQGFIIQNSWGANWAGLEVQGRKLPGCVIWTYPDFEANYMEGFVATLPDSLDSRPRLRRAGYQSDAAEGTDLLNIRSDVDAVCAVLAARDVKPPLALGLFGNWGTGKSFFMAQMHDEIQALAKLERSNPGQTPYCSDIAQIRFNAWHFLDANLWASLVDEIFKSLFAAVAGPAETSDAVRRRVVRALGDARGLFRQSQMELEAAKQEQSRAEETLQEKQSEVRAQENTLHGMYDQLSRLLANRPDVQETLDSLARSVGEPELAQSYQALKTQAEAARTLGGSVKQAAREVWKPEGRSRRLTMLVLFPAVCVLLFLALRASIGQSTGFLGAVRRWTTSLSAVGLGVAAWLAAQIARVGRIVTGVRKVTAEVDAIRDQRLQELTAPEQQKLEARQKEAQQAQVHADQARQRVDQLEEELKSLNPTRQLQDFLKERSGTEDYKKQLGLVTLVRRDFERLSELLARTEALEDRWYARKQAADLANKPFRRKPTLLPMRRIVLYIDDLDRCQPDRVIEVLEAVHLLLAFPLFVVVVAVDPRWLRQCLEMHYPKLLATDATDGKGLSTPSTPQDYLEKIFQIPFYLRPISALGYRNLIDGLTSADLDLSVSTTAQAEGSAQPADQPPATQQVPGKSGMLDVRRPASEDRASTSQQEAVDDRVKMNAERLKFTQWEVSDMKRLARLFHTPRAVKRFVNTYRLIRVSIPEVEMSEFIGTETTPGRYRVAQVLLAVVCGYPNVASLFLTLMLRQSGLAAGGDVTWSDFLATCASMRVPGPPSENSDEHEHTDNASPHPAAGQRQAVAATATPPDTGPELPRNEDFGREWQELCSVLLRLDNGYVPENLSDHYDLVLRVARFSFSVSELPE
jgi:hypothetical protein